MARPSRYTPELAEDICAIVEEGNGLAFACRMVSKTLVANGQDAIADSSVYGWKRDYPEFTERYARAREIQVERMSDEILDISNGTEHDDEDNPGMAYARLQRDRLRIDTRKFLLVKVLPKTFGDRIKVEEDGKLEITLVDETIKPREDEEDDED